MKKEKKLQLKKNTIQNLKTVLDRAEQKTVKGGTNVGPFGTTDVPIYCKI
jgi:hypothetical protein